MSDIVNSAEYRRLVQAAAGEVVESEEKANDFEKLDESVTIELIQEYINWRAMGRTVSDAASLVKIQLTEANKLEKAEDFFDNVIARREEILNDPAGTISSMIPEAIGILKEKARAGNLDAVKEILKFASIIPNSSRKNGSNEDRGQAEGPTAQERSKLSATRRTIQERYSGGDTESPAQPTGRGARGLAKRPRGRKTESP